MDSKWFKHQTLWHCCILIPKTVVIVAGKIVLLDFWHISWLPALELVIKKNHGVPEQEDDLVKFWRIQTYSSTIVGGWISTRDMNFVRKSLWHEVTFRGVFSLRLCLSVWDFSGLAPGILKCPVEFTQSRTPKNVSDGDTPGHSAWTSWTRHPMTWTQKQL